MPRRGPLTPRHLVVAVLVVLVVNAQLTWWIIFVLGQNRARLQLEREQLAAAGREQALRVAGALDAARAALAESVAAAGGIGIASIPEPFLAIDVTGTGPCETSWVDEGDRLVLAMATADGCIAVATRPLWRDHLLDVGSLLEIVERQDRPGEAAILVDLPPPFHGLVMRPHSDVWHRDLREYRGRIAMIVSEGGFFAILLFVLIGLLVRTLRREAELERNHRNFLSAVTHELKSPLAGIRLALETVLSGRADGSDRDRFLDNAMSDTGRLQDLVQKILEVTRYDRGGERLSLGRDSVSQVVADVVDTFCRRVQPLGVRVETDVRDGVWADLNNEAFAIVVSNLLENAVKYGGEPPRVGVRLALEGRRAIFDVTDNGPGVAPNEIQQIFDRFYRGGEEMTRTSNGTGLGLYLVKQIVKAHHGEVHVIDTGPGGSTFRVILPDAGLEEARS